MPRRIPLQLRPGMVVTESIFAEPGRWVDGDKVRFLRGRPQKIGGWNKKFTSNYTGMARGLSSWSDFSQNELTMVGTHCKLQVFDSSGVLTNVTPIEETGTLANPFTTTNLSVRVAVNDASHAREVGDTVSFSGASAVGGITIDGDYIVQEFIDGDNYGIDHSSAATSDAGPGGGASVTYSYELSCGLIDAATGGGYGIGPYGEETYGTERTSTSFLQLPRFWFLAIYGEDMLCLPWSGSLYYFDASVGTTVLPVANAPTSNQGVFVSEDRHIILLGAGGNAMKVQWPDQDTITNWTPGVSSTAGSRTLTSGSRLIAGTVLQGNNNLIWSDTSCYVWQYIGSDLVFASRLAGVNCGLVGPYAYTVVDGIAYWMSSVDFHVYSGFVSEIPNVEDIRTFMTDNISVLQRSKTFCGYIQEFNEVWWFFVDKNSNNEPSLYVAYNISDRIWTKGSLDRTSFSNQESATKEPLLTGAVEDSFVFQHEDGLNDEDGAAVAWSIVMAPFAIEEGSRNMDIWHYEPDFERQEGEVSLEFTTYKHARETSIEDDQKYIITETDEMIDTHASGKYLGLTLSGSSIGSDFRLGNPKMVIDASGDRE